MPRRTGPVLDEITAAIDGISAAIGGCSFSEFCGSWVVRHAVQRGIEIISEASRHIPEAMKATHPEVRWRALAGVGNILRHEYHRISDKVVWDAVHHDLPPLLAAVAAMRRDLRG